VVGDKPSTSRFQKADMMRVAVNTCNFEPLEKIADTLEMWIKNDDPVKLNYNIAVNRFRNFRIQINFRTAAKAGLHSK